MAKRAELKARLTLNKAQFDRGIKAANDQVRRFSMAAKNLGNRSIQAGLVGIGVGAVAAAAGLRKAVQEAANMEQMRTSFGVLLKDAGKATKLLADISKFSMETPLNIPDLAQGAKQMLAFGFSAESMITNMRMLGDVATGLSIPLGDLVYIYGTLRTQGRAYTRDIMQFTMRGVPMIDELAKNMRVSKAEVMSMVEEGKIGFSEVERAFQSMTGKGGLFNGMLEKQGKTFSGRMEQLKESINSLFREMGGPIIDALKPALEGASEFLNKQIPKAKEFGAKLVEGAQAFLSIMNDPAAFQAMLAANVEAAMKSGGNVLFAILGGAGDMFKSAMVPAVQSIGYMLLGAMMKAFQDPIAGFQARIEALAEMIYDLNNPGGKVASTIAADTLNRNINTAKERLAEIESRKPGSGASAPAFGMFGGPKVNKELSPEEYDKQKSGIQKLIAEQTAALNEQLDIIGKSGGDPFASIESRKEQLLAASPKIATPEGEMTADQLFRKGGNGIGGAAVDAAQIAKSIKVEDIFGASRAAKVAQSATTRAANSGQALLAAKPSIDMGANQRGFDALRGKSPFALSGGIGLGSAGSRATAVGKGGASLPPWIGSSLGGARPVGGQANKFKPGSFGLFGYRARKAAERDAKTQTDSKRLDGMNESLKTISQGVSVLAGSKGSG